MRWNCALELCAGCKVLWVGLSSYILVSGTRFYSLKPVGGKAILSTIWRMYRNAYTVRSARFVLDYSVSVGAIQCNGGYKLSILALCKVRTAMNYLYWHPVSRSYIDRKFAASQSSSLPALLYRVTLMTDGLQLSITHYSLCVGKHPPMAPCLVSLTTPS